MFKQRLYPLFARVAQAMANDRRLELLDLLAQGPRHVEALAHETEMSMANVSQHLQVLRAAHLVEAERDGTKVVYRLAGADVLRLWLDLRSVAEERIPEIPQLVRSYAVDEVDTTPLTIAELATSVAAGKVTLIDVRPTLEYEHGHLPGALSMPPGALPEGLDELAPDRPVIAYCRGAYCLFADDAVVVLKARGFEAYRLDGGWVEWSAAEGRVALGV